MANEGDLGNQAADEYLQSALDNARKAAGNERLTGFCQNGCGESTAGAYCSKECRSDHTKRERMNR